MNRKLLYAVGIMVVALAFGAAQVGAQGGLTLESLAERLNLTDKRVAAIETAIAPTETPTPAPDAAATAKAKSTRKLERATEVAQAKATVTAQARATRATARAVSQITATARARARPTATPRPTRTPTPVAANAYRNKAILILTGDGTGWDMASAMFTISDAFTRAGQQPALLLDDVWKIEVTVAVAALQMNYNEARKLKPPANLRRFHNLLIEGLAYCDMAGDQIIRGLDELDADLLEDAVGLIQLCSSTLIRAAEDPNW